MPTNASLLDRAYAHEHRRIRHHAAKLAVHGTGVAGRVNRRVATLITGSVGTMWCAYAFLLLALISAPAAFQTGNPVIIIQWISGAFLQLVLLPVIIVGQNVQAEAQDQRAEADHETLQLLHEINARQLMLIQDIHGWTATAGHAEMPLKRTRKPKMEGIPTWRYETTIP